MKHTIRLLIDKPDNYLPPVNTGIYFFLTSAQFVGWDFAVLNLSQIQAFCLIINRLVNIRVWITLEVSFYKVQVIVTWRVSSKRKEKDFSSETAPYFFWNHHPSQRSSSLRVLTRTSMDCEFMISRCEQHSQASETPSVYSERWIKLTTASPWFMMQKSDAFSHLSVNTLDMTSTTLNANIMHFCTTRSIFAVNSCFNSSFHFIYDFHFIFDIFYAARVLYLLFLSFNISTSMYSACSYPVLHQFL